MKVPFVNLGLQHRLIKDELLPKVSELLDTGQFILGEELVRFENAFAGLCGTKYALGVANGTDALFLAMKVIGIQQGDEVITAPNSYLASASSIYLAGATPVFADVREDFNIDPEQIKKVITSRTKAIMPVHLTGRPADLEAILEIAREHHLSVIEDCAQAVCAEYMGKPEIVNFVYYTFITMSTVGYGDITPRIPETQTLAYFLSVSGQLYVAIIIAFLVGKLLMHPGKVIDKKPE